MMEVWEVEDEVSLLFGGVDWSWEVNSKLPNTLVFHVFHDVVYTVKSSMAEN